METDDVLDGVRAGRFTMWLAYLDDRLIGCLVAQALAYPRLRALNVLFIAGHNRTTWQAAMIETVEECARRNGFAFVEGIGRTGWARVLPGYQVAGFSYEKGL